MIDLCDSSFDTFVSVFVGDCDQLICIGEDDHSCSSNNAKVLLDPSQRQLAFTDLHIAIFGSTTLSSGSFVLRVIENGCNEPPNANCFTPTYLNEIEAVIGRNCGSGFLSSEIAPCLSIDPLQASPTIFYTYFVNNDDSQVSLDFCRVTSFDIQVSIFTGSCDSLICESTTTLDNCALKISGKPAGTELTIAVYGSDMNSFGDFLFYVNEDFVCDPNGPEYNCGTSFSIYTDHKCPGTNQQCAIIPPVSLGVCFDRGINCDCETIQTSGPAGGEDLPAGIYEVVSYAENDNNFRSDDCSYRVNVLNSCDPFGPQTICRADPIKLYTSYSCNLNGERCSVMINAYLARCSDYPTCNCEISQVSGPLPGDKLLPGNYEIVMTGTNEQEYESSLACTIPVNVF